VVSTTTSDDQTPAGSIKQVEQ